MRPRRYLTSKPTTKTVALDSATLSTLELIAPGSLSEAVRFCVQFAIQHGAVKAAAAAHTPAQAQLYLHAVSPNTPLPTTYGGHVMTARPAPEPAPEPIQTATAWTPAPAQVTEPIQPAPVIINGVTQGTEEEYLLYGDDDDDTPAQVALQRVEPLPPLVVHTSTPSAAALAAVAAIALTDDEIRALDPARGGQRPFVG